MKFRIMLFTTLLEIIRTRDAELLKTADIVVDVGSVYDPENHRYDHHQIEFNDHFDEHHKTRLSSAGLIYKHFGRRVLKSLSDSITDEHLEKVYQKLYDDFIEGIDGIDNGVLLYPPGVTPAYKVSTDLSSRISWENPLWNEDDKDSDARFEKAMKVAADTFENLSLYLIKGWLPARTIVEKAIEKRLEAHPSGEVIVLETACPWKDHLEDIEKEKGIEGVLKYVLFPDIKRGYRIQCVSVSNTSFQNRLSLPEPWRGKRDEELSTISGIPGCIFVHASGFIGGNESYEGALQMANLSLELGKSH